MRKPRSGQPGSAEPPAEVGTGYAPAHHGELLQGVFEDDAGRLRRALVTLPHQNLGSRAAFFPSQSYLGIVGQPGLTKVRRAAMLALREFSTHPSPAKGGQVEIFSNVPTGVGMGSSTSDVTATIRAVADYHGVSLSREEVGRLAVLAECASDSIMIDDRVVLFAHRDGVVLETFGFRLPPMVVLGCNVDPHAQVDTLGLKPAEYNDDEIAAFKVLRAGMRRAVATEDVELLGRVATASARINQRFLPKDLLDPLTELCREHGGCGIQIAHSGTVAGLIFDARRPDLDESVHRCRQKIEEMGVSITAVIDVRAEAEGGSAAPAGLTPEAAA